MHRSDDQPSIFSKPFEDDLDSSGPPPAVGAPAEPPASDTLPGRLPRAHAPAPEPAAREGISRQAVVVGSMGLVILVLAGFIAASFLGSADAPAGLSEPSASPTPSLAPQTPEPSAVPTASPTPTPQPTPAGPPAEVATGGWATVTVDELQLFGGAGPEGPSTYQLVRGAVVSVAEGPTKVAGESWYRVVSLGGAAGWASSGFEDDPSLETIGRDPTIRECGQVRRAVFEIVNGAAVATDVLRVGDYALPSGAFDDVTLAAAELVRGMGQEVCFTARLGSDGMPELSTEVSVNACGHVVADGRLYRLEPTDDDAIPLSSQVMEAALVHPALLVGGPADNRMSSNITTAVRMMTNDGTAGCLNAMVTQRGAAVDAHSSASVQQCSVVALYDEFSLKLSPASGGTQAWIKLRASEYEAGRFSLGEPVRVSIDVSGGDQPWASAWQYGPCD
jgi:hypothetical protein